MSHVFAPMAKPLQMRRMRGISLVELMISIAIGLVLMLAITSIYVSSAGAGRVAEAQGRMNEDAQAALTILSQQLRMAGNNPLQPNYASTTPRNPVYDTTTYIVRGCDGTFTNISSAANPAALTCTAGVNTSPDSIAIHYEADQYNTVPTTGGVATDCLGQSLPALTTTLNVWDGAASVPTVVMYRVADNRFYIGTSGVITQPSLYCKGNGNATPQPLVENIEDLQLTYGTSTAASAAMAVAGYLTANSVETQTDLAALANSKLRWDKVMTVRVCVLARSEVPVVTDSVSARYVKCDGTLENNPPDLRLRKAYTTTVVLRNRVTP